MRHLIIDGVHIVLLIGLSAYLWRVSRSRNRTPVGRDGWRMIFFGMVLLLIGSAADMISDVYSNPPFLLLVLTEQVAGYVGGMILLVWGGSRWLLSVRSLSANAQVRDAALAESNERLAAITENLPGIIYRRVRHPDGSEDIPYIGGNLREMLGYEPAEVMATPSLLFDSIHPDDRDLFSDSAAAMREFLPLTVELRSRGRDGRSHWLRCSSRLSRRSDGSVIWDGLLLDITSQKKAQLRAAQAETRLLDALESMEDGFAIFDADDRLAVFNDRYRSILPHPVLIEEGSRFEDILRRVISAGNYGTSEDMAVRRIAVHRCLAEPLECQIADGRWLRICERRTRDGGVVTVLSDISHHRERENLLTEGRARLAVIIAHMADGVGMFDANMRLLICNDRYRKMFVLPPELVEPGTRLDAMLAFRAERGDFGQEDHQQQIRQNLALADFSRSFRMEGMRPDGHSIEIRGNPLPGGGVVLTCTDITIHKRAEEAMRTARDAAWDATRAKSDFLANMSHELRTPLNAIIGFADVMNSELFGPLGTRYHEYIRDILDSGRHLLALINEILDLSKVEAGRLELDEEEVDLNEEVAVCLPMIESRAERTGCHIESLLPADLPKIRGDSRRIRQILLNLLTNAVKFTNPGGLVTVKSHPNNDGGLDITISDTGIGIGAEDIPLVLENWGQARSDRSQEGSGLGLPLSKKLMELHEGRLTLVSQPNQGTTVTLWFPPNRLLQPSSPREPVNTNDSPIPV